MDGSSKTFFDGHPVDPTGASCAFGVFDGLHKGHRFIIDRTISIARESGVPAYIVTFDVDPDEFFCREGFKKIMSNEDRIEALSRSGVDGVVVLDFAKMHMLDARAFLDDVFGRETPYALNVGSDVRFGCEAKGDLDDLRDWGRAHHMEVNGFDLLTCDGAPITSTRVRSLLQDGLIEEANELLSSPYALVGDVVRGRGEGAQMGFRTANIHVHSELFILKDGVYAAKASVDGIDYKAAVSVGVSPTFEDSSTANVEVHILDFKGDLYDDRICVSFVERIRDMIKFDDISKLIERVKMDIRHVNDSVIL